MENNKIVYPQGRKNVTLTALQLLVAVSQAPFQVYKLGGYVNEPDTLALAPSGNVPANTETTFTPAAAATYVILPGAAPVYYAVGVTPRVMSQAQSQTQGDPGVLNATGTLTAAMIASGIVTSTTGAAVAATLDTGAVMDAALDMQIGDSFDWSVIATGGNAFTVTAAASGHTLVGSGVVATVSAAMFRTRKTAANTFITYRLSGL